MIGGNRARRTASKRGAPAPRFHGRGGGPPAGAPKDALQVGAHVAEARQRVEAQAAGSLEVRQLAISVVAPPPRHTAGKPCQPSRWSRARPTADQLGAALMRPEGPMEHGILGIAGPRMWRRRAHASTRWRKLALRGSGGDQAPTMPRIPASGAAAWRARCLQSRPTCSSASTPRLQLRARDTRQGRGHSDGALRGAPDLGVAAAAHHRSAARWIALLSHDSRSRRPSREAGIPVSYVGPYHGAAMPMKRPRGMRACSAPRVPRWLHRAPDGQPDERDRLHGTSSSIPTPDGFAQKAPAGGALLSCVATPETRDYSGRALRGRRARADINDTVRPRVAGAAPAEEAIVASGHGGHSRPRSPAARW